jgi:miniconductance mechanosensitive channel
MIQRLSNIKSIKEFTDRQQKKSKISETSIILHESEITNLTLFRKYIVGVLRNHSGLNHKLPILVRQMQPNEYGMPLEIIAFVKGTDGLVYEELQSDLFDHLIAVMPEFGLEVFQRLSS